uniref:Uncharacterized protein n=1 Tax=Hyaloperonospora arabidopsidis (strain Emoy2) TaxID=559515 RepID=M4BFF5_HYAAE
MVRQPRRMRSLVLRVAVRFLTGHLRFQQALHLAPVAGIVTRRIRINLQLFACSCCLSAKTTVFPNESLAEHARQTAAPKRMYDATGDQVELLAQLSILSNNHLQLNTKFIYTSSWGLSARWLTPWTYQ